MVISVSKHASSGSQSQPLLQVGAAPGTGQGSGRQKAGDAGAQGLGPEGESLMCDDAFTASARFISCMLAAISICLSTVSNVPVVACRGDEAGGWFECERHWWHAGVLPCCTMGRTWSEET